MVMTGVTSRGAHGGSGGGAGGGARISGEKSVGMERVKLNQEKKLKGKKKKKKKNRSINT